jgi:hypothetical protein
MEQGDGSKTVWWILGVHLQWYFVMHLAHNIRLVRVSNILDQMK